MAYIEAAHNERGVQTINIMDLSPEQAAIIHEALTTLDSKMMQDRLTLKKHFNVTGCAESAIQLTEINIIRYIIKSILNGWRF